MDNIPISDNPDPKVLRIFLGSSIHLSLERRILNAAILASAAISTVIVAESLFIGVSILATLMAIAAATIFWIFYGLGRKKTESPWLIWAYLTINLTLFLFDWLFVGGFSGFALPLIVVVTGILPIITLRKQYLVSFGLVSIVFAVFAITTLLFHDRIPQHAYTIERVFDILFETGILALGLAAMTYLVMRSYRHQRDKIQNKNVELADLNTQLENQTQELQKALKEVKTLQGIIPICAKCKKIRDSEGYWGQIESYIENHTDALFSHGLCQVCEKELYGEEDWYKSRKDNN